MDSGVKKCLAGAACLIAWELSQATYLFLLPVYEYFCQAAVLLENGYLLLAAFFLVLLNAFRAVILYNGWFLLGEGVAEKSGRGSVAVALPLVMIPASYWAASYFSSRPHFGVPALLTLASVACIQFLCLDVTRWGYKLVIQSILIFSIQWLDLIPFLTPFGFGWGELSMAVKGFCEVFRCEDMLNVFSALCFAWFFGSAALLAALFLSYEKRIRQMNLIRAKERELLRLRREQFEARLYQEIHYLVHDLKRPLTSVSGLADLLSLSGDSRTSEFGGKIGEAARQMDQMISEIRNPDTVREVSVAGLMNYALSQVRPLPWGGLVRLRTLGNAGEARLSVNLIRISRALVNLLDNARRAARSDDPLVECGAEREGEAVVIFVEDNGPGFIVPRNGTSSGWGSSGLGLRFVREAAAASGGEFFRTNRPEGGVRCELRFREVSPK